MTKMITLGLSSIFAGFILLAINQLAYASGEPLALKGYDTVSYFEVGRAEQGDENISHVWNGKRWHFTSERHRELFVANPEGYAPAYDGLCAWAVSKGYLQSAIPTAWTVENGRLFLNYSQGIKGQWETRKRANIRAGDRRWPNLKEAAARFGL
ncbi:hypothetical protein RHODOSMS8_02183 [Rhodobiaceae bacterium]|nr:hypothetical protein RHODOSMS8_02183 [Rhodobiaceae bacterium]